MNEWDSVEAPGANGDYPVGIADGEDTTLPGLYLPGDSDRADLAVNAGHDRRVLAEWALWGKEDDEPGYRVLRHSKGTFSREDFHVLISRYASGAKESLPQYTICWIPEEHGHQSYLAVGIHEHVNEDPGRAGGRTRTSGGRLVEYVRLFCIPYDGLSELRASYTEVVKAVQDEQLSVGNAEPVQVALPESQLPAPRGPLSPLTENVAALLLTTKPVCVLGAEMTSGWERLCFIDHVAALLPYGLRATLSASTWASATAQNLKLRLFFSGAEIEDGGRTEYVNWGQPEDPDLSASQDTSARLYLSWLRHARDGTAVDTLADQDAIVRFRSAEIRAMVAGLPVNRPIADLLEQLAEGLRRGDKAVVPPTVTRLRHYLERNTPAVAARLAWREQVRVLGLLRGHPKVHPATEASVYRVLLRMTLEQTLTHADYRWIEDAAGGPPRGSLRREMFRRGFTYSGFLPWLLVHKAEAEFTDEDLMDRMHGRGMSADAPVGELMRRIKAVRPQQRGGLYDFAVRYLRAYAVDPRAELIRFGYLADLVEEAFPGKLTDQRNRLQVTLSFVYNGWPASDQISQIYAQPGVRVTKALRDVLTNPPVELHHGLQESIWAYLRGRVTGKVAVFGAALVVFAVVIGIVIALYYTSRG